MITPHAPEPRASRREMGVLPPVDRRTTSGAAVVPAVAADSPRDTNVASRAVSTGVSPVNVGPESPWPIQFFGRHHIRRTGLSVAPHVQEFSQCAKTDWVVRSLVGRKTAIPRSAGQTGILSSRRSNRLVRSDCIPACEGSRYVSDALRLLQSDVAAS